MKILIVGPSWVGDMVMAQTLFQCLRQRHPECVIDVLAPEWSRPILERMPEVRAALKVHALAGGVVGDHHSYNGVAVEGGDRRAPLLARHAAVDDGDGLGRAHTDATKLRQCLINLLSNAAKFTEGGRITLRARREGDSLRFAVEDTGIGMSAEQVGHVAGARGVQLVLPGDAAEHAEVAAAQQRRESAEFVGEGLDSLRVAHLVEDHAEHLRILRAAEQLRLDLDAVGQLGDLLRLVALVAVVVALALATKPVRTVFRPLIEPRPGWLFADPALAGREGHRSDPTGSRRPR